MEQNLINPPFISCPIDVYLIELGRRSQDTNELLMNAIKFLMSTIELSMNIAELLLNITELLLGPTYFKHNFEILKSQLIESKLYHVEPVLTKLRRHYVDSMLTKSRLYHARDLYSPSYH